MKRWLSLLLLLIPSASFGAASRDALWREVDNAVAQGQPRTALERLQPIVDAAVREQAWGEAAKAIARRVVLEARVEGNLPEERVRRFDRALQEAPPPLQPLFRALLGHAYWSYFQQNRWRIQQRTAAPASPSEDFRTWDLRRLFAEIDRQFTAALANPASLQSTAISTFDALLEPGTVPDRHRPTLYDFLAHEALEFYAVGEQAGARPEDAFILEAASPALDDAAAFLAWTPSTTDTQAVAFKAIRLYQDLLRFHAADPDPSARLDADLARLRQMHAAAVGPDRDDRYLAALRTFVNRAGPHELAALARHEIARLRLGRDQPAAAHSEATLAIREQPETPGARLCRNLVRQIEAPATRIATESVWNAPWPTLDVTHRNTPRVWFRIVATDWNRYLDRSLPRPERLGREQRLALLRERPTLEWSADLPATPDFLDQTTRLPVPDALRPGFYFLLASRRADFTEDDNEVSYSPFWVTRLALVVRSRAGNWEGLVLDAESGEPLSGARVEAWYLSPRGDRVPLPAATTGEDGSFAFLRPAEGRSHLFKATHSGQSVATTVELWAGGPPEPNPVLERTTFFTDRGLYRPGQLIHYKGITLSAEPRQGRYHPVVDREITVVLHDANGREVGRARHRLNDFGSFSGTFTAPSQGLAGTYVLAVDGRPSDGTTIQVEEYKRPKFLVTLDPPADAPRLGETVALSGHARTYTGSAIDHARVRWRVTRQVRLPFWSSRSRVVPPGAGDAQEMAHGVATTAADGSFSIRFPALPDRQVAPDTEPIFDFQIQTDVTDAAGETRSAERLVRIGYAALATELTAADWLTSEEPIALAITTRTLDATPASATGIVRIHLLRQPARVARSPLTEFQFRPEAKPAPDGALPENWELAAEIDRQAFQTGTNGVVTNRFSLPAGAYRAILESRDRFGTAVTAKLDLLVIDPAALRLPIRVPSLLRARAWKLEPGRDFLALWGSGYDRARAFVEIERDHQIVQRFWTEPGRTQQILRYPVTEALRGGFTVHLTQVRDNRAYQETRPIEVPWTNQELILGWESFRSPLEPGQRETWSLTIKPASPAPPASPNALHGTGLADPTRRAAELVATLYDASLDQFLPFDWPSRFDCFPTDFSTAHPSFSNIGRWLDHVLGRTDLKLDNVEIRYRDFPDELVARWRMQPMLMNRLGGVAGRGAVAAEAAPLAAMAISADAAQPLPSPSAKGLGIAPADRRAGAESAPGHPAGAPRPALSTRRNLQETAFFLPHLLSDSNGVVRISFNLPESLTEWRFLGFAHDRALRSGRLEGRATATRDLMVQPNPPRFLREGDLLEFTAKVINRSAQLQRGSIRLQLSYALDGSPADDALGNREPAIPFEVPPGESRAYGWRLRVPDGCGFLAFQVTAAGERHSDGEAGYLPVLSRRVYLTESFPLPIRGPAQKQFDFAALRQSGDSPTLRHAGLTVQMASNPAWYAVLALPYLMESPLEGAEQVFNRFYANQLAALVANRDPAIRAMFDQWRGTPALDSPLEKNPELKSVALEETPWLREASNESQARRRVAVLFDSNRLDHEAARALQSLAELQLPDGSWPWFPGGPPDPFITLYLTSGFGRLRQLDPAVPIDPALRALDAIDSWMFERWDRLRSDRQLDGARLDPHLALYLYARSFFLADRPIAPPRQEAFDFWVRQAREHWLKLDHRLPRGHLALALHRLPGPAAGENQAAARTIVQSLREHAVHSEELGMFWREDEHSWSWFRAPIETQALMVEVFDEVARDQAAVQDLQVWLLKQKQTQDWKTTKATADAVYAILRRGPSLLAGPSLVDVQIGDRSITPSPRSAPPAALDPRTPVEPGTGFFEVRIPAAEISPRLASLSVTKRSEGVAWGSVHWQYFETLDQVRPFAGTPLTLRKSLHSRVNTPAGPQLRPVDRPVEVGDELVVRLELRTDRDLEYLHLKDERGSGTEPVQVLSAHRFQDGLGYYESARDTASHFFIAYLPKGTYVFEYPVRVQHRGQYAAGLATIQCLYAPEFNSHSASLPLTVR